MTWKPRKKGKKWELIQTRTVAKSENTQLSTTGTKHPRLKQLVYHSQSPDQVERANTSLKETGQDLCWRKANMIRWSSNCCAGADSFLRTQCQTQAMETLYVSNITRVSPTIRPHCSASIFILTGSRRKLSFEKSARTGCKPHWLGVSESHKEEVEPSQVDWTVQGHSSHLTGSSRDKRRPLVLET